MSNTIFWSILVILAVSGRLAEGLEGIPSSDESLDDLVSAGVSENAAAGIVKFDRRLQEPFEMEKTDPEGAKELEQVLHEEFNEYIDSLSEDDQAAYQKYIKNLHGN